MRIDYLDGIRGILAVAVVVSHISGMITGWEAPWAFQGAYMAVDMFFILSGFVLTLSLTGSRQIGLVDFFYRRFLRLWPLHAIVLVFSVTVYEINRSFGRYAPDGGFSDLTLFLQNAFFLMKLGVWEFPVINPPSYSIGVEFWVSALVVPFIARMRPFAAAAIACTVYAAIAYLWGGVSGAGTIAPYVSLGVLRGVAGMALGSAIFKLNGVYAQQLGAVRPEWACAWFVIVSALVFAAVFGQTNSLLNFPVLFLFSTMLLSNAAKKAGFIYAFLSAAPLVWLGQISFALYLVHMPLLVLIGIPDLAQNVGSYNAAALSLTVCVALSAATYQYVDAPIDRFVKKLRRARRQRMFGAPADQDPIIQKT